MDEEFVKIFLVMIEYIETEIKSNKVTIMSLIPECTMHNVM